MIRTKESSGGIKEVFIEVQRFQWAEMWKKYISHGGWGEGRLPERMHNGNRWQDKIREQLACGWKGSLEQKREYLEILANCLHFI